MAHPKRFLHVQRQLIRCARDGEENEGLFWPSFFLPSFFLQAVFR